MMPDQKFEALILINGFKSLLEVNMKKSVVKSEYKMFNEILHRVEIFLSRNDVK